VRECVHTAGRRFARLATRAVVARPGLWRLFRGPLRAQFNWMASGWEARRGPEALIPLETALDDVERPPARALDLGTGTGKGARVIARRFPDAQVVGVDLSAAMVEEATRLLPADLVGRVSFRVADADALPFENESFDLVVLLNMIPFFTEVARVTAPAGTVVAASSSGPETPIYVPPETFRARLAPLGFDRFDEVRAGDGTAFIARRASA
jgi:SAM-dependent methyltransferase